MTIDNKLIQYLAELSRLTLTEDEKEQAKVDLTKIIEYMAKLNELDTTGYPALSHSSPEVNRFREDRVVNSFDRKEILANAPVKNEVYFKVPQTVE